LGPPGLLGARGDPGEVGPIVSHRTVVTRTLNPLSNYANTTLSSHRIFLTPIFLIYLLLFIQGIRGVSGSPGHTGPTGPVVSSPMPCQHLTANCHSACLSSLRASLDKMDAKAFPDLKVIRLVICV